jgi:hypothetical protein
MFRAAHRSSSGVLNWICSLWCICPYDDSAHSALATAGHHMGIYTRGCKYSLQLLIMSGVPLKTCWAFKKLWNNKFYYKAAFVGISTESSLKVFKNWLVRNVGNRACIYMVLSPRNSIPNSTEILPMCCWWQRWTVSRQVTATCVFT